MPHMGPNHPSDYSVVMSNNKIFGPPPSLPNCIKIVKDILVGNVQRLFQIQEGPLPLNPTIFIARCPK